MQTMGIQEVTILALSVPEQARAIIIKDHETYARAGEVLLTIKDLRKQIDATFDPIIKKAFAAHREAVAQKKNTEAPLVEAENYLKPLISTYMAEQERIRQTEEARIRRELAKQEEETRLQAAIEAEKAGNKDEAEEILSEPIPVSPVVLAKTTPKVEGISTRELWRFRIVDVTKIPREYLMPNETAIGGVVRSSKGAIKIPGVENYKEDVVSAGRR